VILLNYDDLQKLRGDRFCQRFVEHGLDYFDDCEVLELILFCCNPDKDCGCLAHELINEFGSLSNLFDSDPVDVSQKCKLEFNVSILFSMIPSLARLYLKSKYLDEGKILNSTRKIGNYAVGLLAGRDIEHLYMICLNKQKKLLKTVLVSSGTINETPVYLRELVEIALKHKAVSIVLVHNHPNSSFLPSPEDIASTKKICNIFESLEIQVLDHIIVSGNQYYSFVERNKF
jgi:DNA repair protein RadC